MSNVDLCAILVEGNTYALTTMPSKTNGIFKLIPNLTLNDQFIFIKNEMGMRSFFKHVKTAQTVALNSAFFLNSDRFFYVGREKSTVKTALLVGCKSTLYPVGSSDRSLRSSVRSGTIFTSFVDADDQYYIVTDNLNTQYRIYKSSCVTIVDLNFKQSESPIVVKESEQSPTILAVVDKPIKKSHRLVVPTKEQVEAYSIIETVSYKVNGHNFSDKQDAQFVSGLIKQVQALASHSFTNEVDAVITKQMLLDLLKEI